MPLTEIFAPMGCFCDYILLLVLRPLSVLSAISWVEILCFPLNKIMRGVGLLPQKHTTAAVLSYAALWFAFAAQTFDL